MRTPPNTDTCCMAGVLEAVSGGCNCAGAVSVSSPSKGDCGGEEEIAACLPLDLDFKGELRESEGCRCGCLGSELWFIDLRRSCTNERRFLLFSLFSLPSFALASVDGSEGGDKEGSATSCPGSPIWCFCFGRGELSTWTCALESKKSRFGVWSL